VLTVGWLVVLAIYLLASKHSFSALWDLPANNFGDFLAGAFAPVAFLWLAIAVLLQRRELELQRQELKHNREALTLQAEELRRTVEENAAQARSLEASKEYARQEVIIRVTESTIRSLAILACNMWHALLQYRRSMQSGAHGIVAPEAYWKRYADGDHEIWFVALREALEHADKHRTAQNLETIRSSQFRGWATSFEAQCGSAELTLHSLEAPTHMSEPFRTGRVKEIRVELRKIGATLSTEPPTTV
jgi:hypothetical protein